MFMQRGIARIVDDDSSIRWVLERALTGAGLSCTTFESGNEVLDALTTKTPDVLLSDIRMPEWMVWRCSNRLSSAIQCFRSS
ncbi:response regulator [Klebsiella pneumoniae]|uniref:Response regulator n=1 Tax=Klebsiella pneumoniae TaxID=573 RepID=A0A939SS86_KLEPN|nr:response regulator [Klebsiella pneumoniae]